MIRVTKRDWQLAALYRIASKRNLSRETIRAAMIGRLCMAPIVAEQLSAHWSRSIAASRRPRMMECYTEHIDLNGQRYVTRRLVAEGEAT